MCLQGLAAGLMLSISLLDLLPEAVEEIGAVTGNGCFYLGVLFFAGGVDVHFQAAIVAGACCDMHLAPVLCLLTQHYA